MKKNNILRIYLAVIVVCYAFFFNADMLLYGSVTATASSTGTVMTYESRNITINRWEYSPTQNLMEIELSVENLAYDGINDYDFTCVIRPTTEATITQIISEDNYIVLQISDIPEDFIEVSLRLSVETSNETLKMYTTIDEIDIVDNLEVKTLLEYQIDALYRSITDYESQIDELYAQIESEENTITNIESSILTDEESKQYKTDDEVETINDNIEEKYKLITEKEALISSYKLQIIELNTKIDNIVIQISNLGE